MVEPALFGPLDVFLAPVIEYVVLGLVVVNLLTRLQAHRLHVRQAASGAETLTRYPLHEASNAVLVLATLYFLTIQPHPGMVLSVIVIGMLIADFFEFEGRQLELRQNWSLDQPKGAMFVSVLALLYASYISLFWVVKPLWNLVV